MQITDNLHMFLGTEQPLESNSYLILGKPTILVDTGIRTENLIKNIKSVGIKVSDIDIIVNTHCHFDHIKNNKELKDLAGAKLAAQVGESEYISKAEPGCTRCGFHKVVIEPVKVDINLKDGGKLGDFEVLHTPGHTQGSICLFNQKNRVLITGDTLFASGYFGRTDLPTGSQKEILKSLKKLSKLDVKKILPGHGAPVLVNAKENIMIAIEKLADN